METERAERLPQPQTDDEAEDQAEPDAEVASEPIEEKPAEAEKPKRRRGGGGGATKRGTASKPSTAKAKATKATTPAGKGRRRKPSVARESEKPAAQAPVTAPTVVRTGSTDRHLIVDDEPVLPQPARRPRSVRDLDSIPDDFDE